MSLGHWVSVWSFWRYTFRPLWRVPRPPLHKCGEIYSAVNLKPSGLDRRVCPMPSNVGKPLSYLNFWFVTKTKKEGKKKFLYS